jgi:hypothetical protein
MPVIYGECEEEAFIRLAREVIQRYHMYSGQFLRIIVLVPNEKGRTA